MLYYVNIIMAVFSTKNLKYNKFSSEKQKKTLRKSLTVNHLRFSTFSPFKQGYVYKKNQSRFAFHHLPEISSEEIEAIK